MVQGHFYFFTKISLHENFQITVSRYFSNGKNLPKLVPDILHEYQPFMHRNKFAGQIFTDGNN